jgi:hypothetical protein
LFRPILDALVCRGSCIIHAGAQEMCFRLSH